MPLNSLSMLCQCKREDLGDHTVGMCAVIRRFDDKIDSLPLTDVLWKGNAKKDS